ncbi:MAG: PSD1 domain-containing protein [Pirellulales bacterium]|nr:PSD1 domain-containing protein [Pirellulales bacterium]
MLKLRLLYVGIVVSLGCFVPSGNAMLAAEAVIPQAVKPGSSEAEFFESNIRPLLAAHCKECHGEKKQEMGLRVDRREAFFRGGDDGPVVVPGNPEKSLLIEAVRHQGGVHMPPNAKLPEAEIAALTRWVQLGVPWPEEPHNDIATEPAARNDAKNHWAFQPVQRPELPDVKAVDWIKSPIDRFILAKLEAAGLAPSPAADRRTLIRRATFDLIGLPPTPEEIETFVADDRPDAYERLVDRLLESPHYGERWGRYWLDVARYADNKGYAFDEERDYPYAYLYRDWVVQALNDDMPYDQFLLKQLAADRLPRDDDASLAALGFLTLGRRFLNNNHDIIDDRIDVVFRGLQGLTVTCARCHDHKYDPIPTSDYYSIYGVFDDCEEKAVSLAPPSEEYRTELAKREAAHRDYVAQERAKVIAHAKSKTAEFLLAVYAQQQGKAAEDGLMFAQPDAELPPAIVARWRTYLEGLAKHAPRVWLFWNELTSAKPEEFPAKLSELLVAADANSKANRLLLAEIQTHQPKSLADLAQCYARVLQTVDEQWKRALEAARGQDPPKQLDDADAEELRQVYYGSNLPLDLGDADFKLLLPSPAKKESDRLREKVVQWSTSENAPGQAYVLEDKPNSSQHHVFLRGNPAHLGKVVPKRFPGVVAVAGRKTFQNGSGRLEMARVIVSPMNPLTARVIVNRVWMYHFCAPLVNTPSDFGTRSEPPTHPVLLDYLADELVKGGWSLKNLHRELMLSATYRQTSLDRDECDAVDPNNRLLWRINRRRLDWEALRDSIAFVSGGLDLTVGGKPVDLFAQRTRSAGFGVKPLKRQKANSADDAATRRTLYGFIDRQNLPGVLRTFDFALPDTHSPKRFSTIVPPQALYLMNNAFVVECAADFAKRESIASLRDETNRVQRMYAVAFGRSATEAELSLVRQFLHPPASGKTTANQTTLGTWERLAQSMIMTNEFAFVD